MVATAAAPWAMASASDVLSSRTVTSEKSSISLSWEIRERDMTVLSRSRTATGKART